MKKGDLVLLKEEQRTKGINPGVGIILEVRYVNTVIVQWAHEVHWNELEDLIPLPLET